MRALGIIRMIISLLPHFSYKALRMEEAEAIPIQQRILSTFTPTIKETGPGRCKQEPEVTVVARGLKSNPSEIKIPLSSRSWHVEEVIGLL